MNLAALLNHSTFVNLVNFDLENCLNLGECCVLVNFIDLCIHSNYISFHFLFQFRHLPTICGYAILKLSIDFSFQTAWKPEV